MAVPILSVPDRIDELAADLTDLEMLIGDAAAGIAALARDGVPAHVLSDRLGLRPTTALRVARGGGSVSVLASALEHLRQGRRRRGEPPPPLSHSHDLDHVAADLDHAEMLLIDYRDELAALRRGGVTSRRISETLGLHHARLGLDGTAAALAGMHSRRRYPPQTAAQ